MEIPDADDLTTPTPGLTTAWTAADLDRVGEADELSIAAFDPDGRLSRPTVIWVVRAGHDLYVRSAYGRDNPWFRRALATGNGRIEADGLVRDVAFEEPGPDVAAAVTAAFHAKYDHYGHATVDPVTSAESERATIMLVAR